MSNPAQLTLELRYAHGVGDLLPYFEALARGEGRATRCAQCARAWFPPRLVCPRCHAGLRWIVLPGTGVVRAVTRSIGRLPFDLQSRPLVLALIAMDGADNLAMGRIAGTGDVRAGDVVRLVPDLAPRGGQTWSAVFEVLSLP